MSTRLVIMGTDTGVGKTVVTAAVAAIAVAAGRPVRVLKPVQTGTSDGDDDASEVDRLVGAAVSRRGWAFAAPLAPAVAARLEGRRVDPAELVAWIDAQTLIDPADSDALVLVETAGGAAVEIDPGYDMAALAHDLDAPAILVCRPGLGTLNHVALTVGHLRAAGVTVAGLVISRFPAQPGISERTNPAELERITLLDLLGILPDIDPENPATLREAASAGLGPALGGNFDRAAWTGATGG